MIRIKSIHIYPVKSMAGIELNFSEVERKGLKHDRRWMLVDETGRFLSQREFSKLALLQPSIAGNQLVITDKSGALDDISIEIKEPDTQPISVTVWDDTFMAKPLHSEVNEWFSKALESPVRIVFMHAESKRIADQRYAPKPDDMVSFADGYPILGISQESLDLLCEKLGYEIPMNRFRPNIVFEGLAPNEEDTLAEITINKLRLHGVKPCARCTITTIDQHTAEKGKEPLTTLSTYRKIDHKILFGENFIPAEGGVLKVGDEVSVLRKKKPLV